MSDAAGALDHQDARGAEGMGDMSVAARGAMPGVGEIETAPILAESVRAAQGGLP